MESFPLNPALDDIVRARVWLSCRCTTALQVVCAQAGACVGQVLPYERAPAAQMPGVREDLFEGFWVASALSITIHCRCKRIVEIQQDYQARIVQEQQPPTR